MRTDRAVWLTIVALTGLAAAAILMPAQRARNTRLAPPPALAAPEAGRSADASQLQGLAGESWRRYVSHRPRGRIVLACDGQIVTLDPNTGRFETAASVPAVIARVSPDGRSVVYCGSFGVWVLSADGKARRVSNAPFGPVWGADSKVIIGGKGNRLRLDGSPLAPLPIPSGHWVEDASLDGRKLLTRGDPNPAGGAEQLYVMELDGSGRRQLTHSGRNLFARFSPDSRRIVYTHVKDVRSAGDAAEDGLWVVETNGKDRRQVLPVPVAGVDMRACWSPDGKSLAVVMNRQAGDRQRNASSIHRVQIVNLSGKTLRAVDLPGDIWIWNPDWR